MKIIEFITPILKAAFGVVAFLVGIGWAAYGAIILVVRAEGQEIEKKVMHVRQIDLHHLDSRFDRLEKLIRETK